MSRPFLIVESPSAAARLAAIAARLLDLSPTQAVTIVGATRAAADDFARRLARARRATVGLYRFSLTQLAAHLASAHLAGRGIAPATPLGAEAVAARAVFDAVREESLSYFGDVAGTPGFPRAVARTLADLRLAHVTGERVRAAGRAGPDLDRLLSRAAQELDEAGTADRAQLFASAADAVAADASMRVPLVLLDVPIESAAEGAFVAALTAAAPMVLATCPTYDADAAETLRRAGGVIEHLDDGRTDDLGSLRRHLFAEAAPPERSLDGSLEFLSAPGEGRESVEIARRLLREARRGVPFDDMAILVRAPQPYHGLLEHALARAGVPAWFDRGIRRPHPAGRAFLALLACAGEGLSARRFAEYLSLGQLPVMVAAEEAAPGEEAASDDWVPALDEALPGSDDVDRDDAGAEDDAWAVAAPLEGDRPAGTLRAPRRWERLLVEAAVIGGGPERWARRLDGLEQEFRTRLQEAARLDPDTGRTAALERDLAHLGHLRGFALPLVEELATWTGSAPWGVWLDRLTGLAPRVLRVPAYVLRVLGDLRPMATVGPVGIDEVRGVLAPRLQAVEAEPPRRRYGRVFVGSPAQARGRSFRVVFVPGLAERMFPQKAVQDPLLLDAARARLDGALSTRSDRGRLERVLLHIAAGAATERMYVSYPRLDIGEGRVRVPSFYALDLLRGATGRIPDHETLAAVAAAAGDPSLAWPAPADPGAAIDDQEHDLAVLRLLLDSHDPAAVRGHAQYLLRLNPALRRSVTERWARGERRWSPFDGLTRVTDATRPVLEAHRLGARNYSLTALQRFSACPYQFLLGAIYRLQPADHPQPLQRLDPLTRGSIVHRMQADVLRTLRAEGLLPVTATSLGRALDRLETVVARVADAYRDDLSPAIERVWREEIAVIARDLRGWLRHQADEGGEWMPHAFELAFGLPLDAQHDPASSPDPVVVDGRYRLRGSIDLVDVHRTTGALRVTDHKTGRNRTTDTLVIDGGAVLQPMLYSLVAEGLTGAEVRESRLFFCTSAGGYAVRSVALTPQNRRLGVEALEVVDRAIAHGFLAAAPRQGACARCDFRPVCGSDEERRIQRKPADRLHDLLELRSRP